MIISERSYSLYGAYCMYRSASLSLPCTSATPDVNALATAEAIRASDPETVTLVAMGWGAKRETEEDMACARYLALLLQGERPDVEAFRSPVLATAEARKFDDPAQPHFHPRDRDIALSVDAVPFAIRVNREDDLLVARRESVPHVEAELLDSVSPI